MLKPIKCLKAVCIFATIPTYCASNPWRGYISCGILLLLCPARVCQTRAYSVPPASPEPKIAGGGARGNKSEGFAQEVHRRHPPLGRRGQERRLDRQRPRDEPFVGAIVPLAQRYLPPRSRLDAARPAGLLFLRRGAGARRSRHLVRPRSRERPPLAETLEEHREGRAAPHTDQDSARPPRKRQKLLALGS